MGESDYNNRLYPVYRKATDLCKDLGIPCQFRIDRHQETAIIFNLETGKYRKRAPTEPWESIKYPELQIVPDICDYDNKMIIEFEEEPEKRKPGDKQSHSGHHREGDMPKKKDVRRNGCYKRAGFALHQVWESHFYNTDGWKIALADFLIECWRKKCNDGIKAYDKMIDLEASG